VVIKAVSGNAGSRFCNTGSLPGHFNVPDYKVFERLGKLFWRDL